MTNQPVRLRSARGFTLIELMIAVAIVGILAAIAYPSYLGSVRKAHRSDAKTALLDLAQREERYMSTSNAYTTDAVALGYNAGSTVTVAAPMNVVQASTTYYTMKVELIAANPTATPPTPAGFLATATAVGTQVKDTACPSYTLANTGVQGPPSTATACW
jgi:type IV pilus assembly protein PilE